MEIEKTFLCPHCWQRISVVINTLDPAQTFVEDCHVCCNPIQISYTLREDEDGDLEIADFVAEKVD